MDLTSDQHRRITAFIQDWSKDKTMELETTFGERGIVDSNTFLQIAQRLRAKGFEMMPQDDRLSILTPNQLRISIQGLGVIQLYCKDDSLQNKTYTVMAKSRTSPDSNIDLRDYHVRFKMRRESDMSHDDPLVVPIISNWTNQKKAFRLIRRWSFRGKGIRFDLSMVRQSPTLPTGEFKWATQFLQQNILTEPPRYEVEVELLHDEVDTATPELAYSSLIRGVGEVLRAIQKNSLLIRASVADKVRAEYAKVVGTSRFRGVGPVTLEVKNMKKDAEEDTPNVRSGYNVTDKADGLRALGYVNPEGELFLLDQSTNVYRTGLRNPACANSLVDGEWVTLTADGKPINHYLLFDIYHSHNGHTAWDLPFATFKEQLLDVETPSRFNKLKEWYQKWTTGMEYTTKSVQPGNRLLIALKRFEFALSSDSDLVFRRCCSAILDASRIYHTDGLILTSNSQPLPGKAGGRFIHQFKWKPAKDNTVDFLIKYERNPELAMDKITTTMGPTNDVIQYKTMHLYVGGTTRSSPRDMILNQLELNKEAPGGYHAILFTPLDFSDTMANTCYVPVIQDAQTLEFYSKTEDSEEPISDNSVVEMRYDPTREPGWRWVPSRIRHDKTERLLRAIEAAKATNKSIVYSGVMNDEAVANSVWNSIHEPITLSMIRSGNEQPNEEEMRAILNLRGSEITKTYYQRNAPKENMAFVNGLRDFHNTYIKDTILLKTALRTGKNIIDVACGKGGDLRKWITNGARNVLGIDYAGENITNPKDGAYRRYMEAKLKYHNRVPNMAFVIGSSARRIVNGEAGANQQESDILRSIFGKENPQGALPPYIERVMAGTFLGGADVAACMFALHYFFESPANLDGFLHNLTETVKPNGLFVGCCFDGDNVFKLLRGLNIHESIVRSENDTAIWSITKEYEQHELLVDESSIGMGIDVEFISIGSKHREYLVSFPYLVSRLAKIGFRLLNEKELAELNLKQSTSTFDVSHAMAAAQRMNYRMVDSVKEFSFLNRWFIFKRQGAVEAVAPPSELLEPDAPEEEPMQELDDEKVEVEVEVEAPSVFRLPPRDKMWEAQQVFSFGMDAVRKDILKVVDPKGKPDINIGRWLSLAAPFPIPDPMPNLDDPSAEPLPNGAILYPSIEHYIAGMKLKHALVVPRRPGEPDLGQLLMSMDGDIHQKAEKKRRESMQAKRFLPESDDDYKLLVKEAQDVRKFFTTRKQINQYKADISDDKWLPIRDKYLYDALRYRFKFDARFQVAIIAAKNDKKYLLHTKASTNSNINETSEAVEGSASELYGKRDVSRKIILGKNKVGAMLMEIAGFQF
jgi:mRNA (guanine-N7-)-methyltransferase